MINVSSKFLLVPGLLLATGPLPAQDSEGFLLDPVFKLRPRYEAVDDGNDASDNASALTTRTTLGMGVRKSGMDNLRGYFEATHVAALVRDYNSTSSSAGNAHTEYAAVLDPPMTRVTQGYLTWKAGEHEFTAGRRLLALDNHRFIGTVGWRQMPQSFSLVEAKFRFTPAISLQLDYLYERLGIKDELNKRYEKGPRLLHAVWKPAEGHSLSLFVYQITNLHDTMGLRYTGAAGPATYGMTYATQGKASIEEDDVTAPEADSSFYDVDLGFKFNPFSIGLNYHVLGEAKGDAASGFSTPFATLHKWEGWSDVLLSKAAGGDPLGLKAASVNLGWNGGQAGKFNVIYHKFDSVEDSLDYGSEVDFVYKYVIDDKNSVVLKGAQYSKSDDLGNNDVSKYWLMTSHSL